jgi:para-aminobenzoate synthetase component I
MQERIIDGQISLGHLLNALREEKHFLLINNSYPGMAKEFEFLAGVGILRSIAVYDEERVNKFIDDASRNNQVVFGHFAYGLKNKFEKLHDQQADPFNWPELHLFVAETEIRVTNSQTSIINHKGYAQNISDKLKDELKSNVNHSVHCNPLISKEDYLQAIEKTLSHIRRGDIYEMNYCMPFDGTGSIDAYAVYSELCKTSPAPFSCMYRMDQNYVLCMSPERFLQKNGNRIISQPMKGTAKRGMNEEDDIQLKKELAANEKERSENVMIVDLVRNDLSRFAERGSVHVDELFGVYTFPSVHQMISTVSCTVASEIKFTDILRATFPMGSMTGAPKIRAMQIINDLEAFNRGIYSGSVGFILPNGDFDFNVVIRSIIYNEELRKVRIAAGGAITFKSDAVSEYHECLLKAQALIRILAGSKSEISL